MEKYFKMLEKIENNKIDIVKLYLLSSINMVGKSKEKDWEMVNYCYDLWIETNVNLDLGRLADIVTWNWEKIQNDEMADEEIIEECVTY